MSRSAHMSRERMDFHAEEGSLPTYRCRYAAAVHHRLGQGDPGVIVESRVAMKTRDGVTLRADIYRPDTDGSFPVLLTRTPYNKDGVGSIARQAAARGYLVVVQDVRGRLLPKENGTRSAKSQDGYDTVEWAALFLIPTARSACLEDHMWAPPRC